MFSCISSFSCSRKQRRHPSHFSSNGYGMAGSSPALMARQPFNSHRTTPRPSLPRQQIIFVKHHLFIRNGYYDFEYLIKLACKRWTSICSRRKEFSGRSRSVLPLYTNLAGMTEGTGKAEEASKLFNVLHNDNTNSTLTRTCPGVSKGIKHCPH